ncbi:MAG TPA: flagellar hook capping FlgD N-terminal domain-containing protein [Edaphobacter sp.]|nr:flagellar hook capping FlgD N-terminal domain-containing protein [Edaphobacter sp.]
MDGVQMSSITGVGSAAAQKVASALAPRSTTTQTTAATAKASTTSSTTSSTSTGSTITANDFLTLLVSELKNQDPTQPTDPTAYITQMVGVNSLQQLIEINSGLASVEGTSTSTTSV